ncbi:MAG: acyltransferase [Solobacterium sp.]|nr:acyltransferase [Solobacterium sp.]
MTGILNSIIALTPLLLLVIPSESTEDFFDPAERSVTLRYRGFFAVLVILHHMAQRVTEAGLIRIYIDIGYLAVAGFFFYSGYGLMKKGIEQKKGYFRRRLPGIILPYILTLVIYWIIYALTGDVKNFGSLMAEHLHNTSGISFLWFIFVYVFWIVFLGIALKMIRSDIGILYAAILFSAGFLGLFLVFIPSLYWIYDSILLLPLGCAWAYYEKNVLRFIREHYASVLLSSFLLFCVTLYRPASNVLRIASYLVSAIVFMILLNTVTMKRRPLSRILSFLGSISYEIYLLHGIPITFLRNVLPNEALWTLSVLIIAVLSAWMMHTLGRSTWNRRKAK